MGVVSQLVSGGGKLLQGFPNELVSSLQLRVECCFQVVVTVAVLESLSNVFLCHSGRNAT